MASSPPFPVLFANSAALLGLFVAGVAILLGRIFDEPAFDDWPSMRIGVILAVAAARLTYESKLLNPSAEFGDALSAPAVEDVVSTPEERIRERFPQVRRAFTEAESPGDRKARRRPSVSKAREA